MKRTISIILALMLLLGALPLTAFAEEADLADTGAILAGTTGSAEFSVDNRSSNLGYKLTVDGRNTAYASTAYYDADNTNELSNAPWMGYADRITQIEVKGIKTINHAFYSCKNTFTGRDSHLVSDTGLTVKLDENLTEIHGYAFANAHITSIDFKNCDNVTTIKNNAFQNNDFEVLDTRTKDFGDSAFENCKNLKTVKFAYGAKKTIGKNAFKGCTSINYVYWVGTPDEFYEAVDAKGGNEPLKNAATIVFSQKNKKKINSSINTTVKEPITGVSPDYSVTLSSNSYCDLMKDTMSGTGLTIMNHTTGQPANNNHFVSGNTYRYYVSLQGKSGKENGRDYEYVFTADTPVYINGKKAAFDNSYGGSEQNEASFYVDFIPKDMNFVNSVNLTITAPTAGTTPNFTVTKDNSNCDFYTGFGILAYHGTGLEFLDHSKGTPKNSPLEDLALYMNVDSTETFKAGQTYTARVFLSTSDKTDTYFGPEFSAKINGKKATVGGDTSNGNITLIWVDYTFTVPSASSGSTVSGGVTSYLNASDPVTVKIVNKSNGAVVKSTTTTTGSYSISEVPNGSYILQASKHNHVDRDYSITVSGNTTQDVKICPIGDADNNGRVNAADAKAVFRHSNDENPITDSYKLACADVASPKNRVNSADAKAIFQHANEQKSLWTD